MYARSISPWLRPLAAVVPLSAFAAVVGEIDAELLQSEIGDVAVISPKVGVDGDGPDEPPGGELDRVPWVGGLEGEPEQACILEPYEFLSSKMPNGSLVFVSAATDRHPDNALGRSLPEVTMA